MAGPQVLRSFDPVTDRGFNGRKILFIVNDPSFFLSHRKNIALAAAAEGAKIVVACPQGPSAGEIQRLGFDHYTIAIDRWGFRPWSELRCLWQIYNCFRRVRPDLVHHVTIKPVIYGTIAAAIARVPAVINAVPGLGQVFSAAGKRAAVRRQLVRGLYRVASRNRRAVFIFQNPDDRRQFIEQKIAAPENTVIIPGAGVDLELFKFHPEQPGIPLVLFAGRLLRDKGIGEFIETARIIKHRGIAARFVVIGEAVPGNPASVSESQLSSWHKDSAVEFWGLRSDIPAILAASQIVCLPSYYGEGIPKILIEAAAAGRPAVSTLMPGCREIVRHGENGLLVPPRDAAALAGAVEILLRDGDLRQEMGRRGRLLVEQGGFSEAAVVKKTLSIYERQFAAGLPAERILSRG